MTHSSFETRPLSSLAKVFPDEPLQGAPFRSGSALRGETYAFQLAYRSERLRGGLRVCLQSNFGDSAQLSVRQVGLSPSELPCYDDADDDVLRKTPGLYPDPLLPLADGPPGLVAYPGQWRSLWISVRVPDDQAAGRYELNVSLESEGEGRLGGETYELNVIGASLPEQRLIHTEWFHTDCLAVHYGVDVFSEAHWTLIDRFVHTAVEHGINMILTPLFTPPLDTAVGGERPTVQLVDVTVRQGDDGRAAYSFGFDKLRRWVELCRSRGVRYFEFSHLFTQWGAAHAPKIVAAAEDGGQQRIFGWDTDAAGETYKSFLRQFMPELLRFVRDNGLADSCFFHVSDEPNMNHLESYSGASALVSELVGESPVIDALSDYAFYEQGLIRKPIPASNHIEPFLEHGVDKLWTYYCCGQYKQVSNRFFNMPSARNRMIGYQLFKFDIEGFLHWGYNFWFTQHSRRAIDPFRVTDAGGAFPSGDAFLVYPGEDGHPVESIRLQVFREALQDLRALRLLESLVGRERALAAAEEELAEPLTFSVMPRDADWLLRRRESINALIAEAVAAAG